MKERVWAVESNRVKLDGGALFGNAPRALWERWFSPDAENRLEMACRSLLVESCRGRWLFEAGGAAFYPLKLRERYGTESTHRLRANLQKLGIEEESIDGVVLTHLHFDHAGGLLPAEGEGEELLFPRATYFVSQEQWEVAHSPHPREKASFVPKLLKKLEQSGRLELFDQQLPVDLGFEVRFFASEGHTRGMRLPLLSLGERLIGYAADLVPARAWMRPALAMGYDRFAERALDEKRAFLQLLAKKGGELFFTHDPSVNGVRVVEEKGEFLAEPLEPDAFS